MENLREARRDKRVKVLMVLTQRAVFFGSHSPTPAAVDFAISATSIGRLTPVVTSFYTSFTVNIQTCPDQLQVGSERAFSLPIQSNLCIMSSMISDSRVLPADPVISAASCRAHRKLERLVLANKHSMGLAVCHIQLALSKSLIVSLSTFADFRLSPRASHKFKADRAARSAERYNF